MKNAIFCALLLSGLARAEPYRNKTHHFQADFASSVEVEQGEGAFGKSVTFVSKSSACLVSVVSKRVDLDKVLAEMVKRKGIREVEKQAIQLQGFPGLRWSGFDPKGCPFSALIVATSERTYFAGVLDFDMGLHRQFLDSFRVLK